MYDGPIIKLRINYFSKEQRLFDFLDLDYGNEINNFIKLHYYLDSLFSLKMLNTINDTTDFEKSRSEFIRFVINYDTTHYPKVPLPSLMDSN